MFVVCYVCLKLTPLLGPVENNILLFAGPFMLSTWTLCFFISSFPLFQKFPMCPKQDKCLNVLENVFNSITSVLCQQKHKVSPCFVFTFLDETAQNPVDMSTQSTCLPSRHVYTVGPRYPDSQCTSDRQQGRMGSDLWAAWRAWYARGGDGCEEVRAALERGEDPNTRGGEGWYKGSTLLREAAWDGSVGVVKTLLLDPRTDVNATEEPTGLTALHMACLRGHGDMVRLLLAHGANHSPKSSD